MQGESWIFFHASLYKSTFNEIYNKCKRTSSSTAWLQLEKNLFVFGTGSLLGERQDCKYAAVNDACV